jgi:hypothetical protein
MRLLEQIAYIVLFGGLYWVGYRRIKRMLAQDDYKRRVRRAEAKAMGVPDADLPR